VHPEREFAIETRLLHADRSPSDGTSVAPPIYQPSTFTFDNPQAMALGAQTPQHPGFYTRHGNPNHAQVAAVLAAIEGGEAALVASSGMGAISATAVALLQSGDHVVAQRMLYAGTRTLMTDLLPRYGVEVTFVDQHDAAAFAAAMRPNTRLIWMESPSNPLLGITDIARVVEIARSAGALTAIDNTIASPINQRPLELGADIVVHSATKYLGGHSDLIAGAAIASKALIDRIWKTHIVLGATLAPFEAWLLLRGLRTLDLRMARHNANGQAVAAFLAGHARVRRVYYPGLATHPNHDVAARQMRGFGGLLSFEVDGGFDDARRVVERLRLIRNAVSLGGVESLIAQPAAMWPNIGAAETAAAAAMGVMPSLLRLSVGIENVDDLLADLDSALSTL